MAKRKPKDLVTVVSLDGDGDLRAIQFSSRKLYDAVMDGTTLAVADYKDDYIARPWNAKRHGPMPDPLEDLSDFEFPHDEDGGLMLVSCDDLQFMHFAVAGDIIEDAT